jgi:hypothetical protein
LQRSEFQNLIHSDSSGSASNCLRIVIFCILYAWHWHIWDMDNNLWGLMMQITLISFFAMVGFLAG